MMMATHSHCSSHSSRTSLTEVTVPAHSTAALSRNLSLVTKHFKTLFLQSPLLPPTPTTTPCPPLRPHLLLLLLQTPYASPNPYPRPEPTPPVPTLYLSPNQEPTPRHYPPPGPPRLEPTSPSTTDPPPTHSPSLVPLYEAPYSWLLQCCPGVHHTRASFSAALA